jgi:hypothetical protein
MNYELQRSNNDTYGERGEMHRGVWWRDPREREHLEDLGVDEKAILKWIFKKWDREAWTRLL